MTDTNKILTPEQVLDINSLKYRISPTRSYLDLKDSHEALWEAAVKMAEFAAWYRDYDLISQEPFKTWEAAREAAEAILKLRDGK